MFASVLSHARFPCNHRKTWALSGNYSMEEMRMKKALAILALAATIAATPVAAPPQAPGRARRFQSGPGLGIGLAVGALAAGAYGAYGYPGYYGYYGPRSYGARYYGYGPGYYPGPYAYGGYYGGPYWGRRYGSPYW